MLLLVESALIVAVVEAVREVRVGVGEGGKEGEEWMRARVRWGFGVL